MTMQAENPANVAGIKPIHAGEATIFIAAPPLLVYNLISDVTRMGEWSPECYRCEWLDGVNEPILGARFKGYNKWKGFKWARTSEIRAAKPGEEFAFSTIWTPIYRDSTDWRYTMRAVGLGTEITESFALNRASFLVKLVERYTSRGKSTVPAMHTTLERLKAVAEAQARGRYV
jgi:uncharacterized protein YndB with AHSA1/START domain